MKEIINRGVEAKFALTLLNGKMGEQDLLGSLSADAWVFVCNRRAQVLHQRALHQRNRQACQREQQLGSRPHLYPACQLESRKHLLSAIKALCLLLRSKRQPKVSASPRVRLSDSQFKCFAQVWVRSEITSRTCWTSGPASDRKWVETKTFRRTRSRAFIPRTYYFKIEDQPSYIFAQNCQYLQEFLKNSLTALKKHDLKLLEMIHKNAAKYALDTTLKK